jgi:hypothetical protein
LSPSGNGAAGGAGGFPSDPSASGRRFSGAINSSAAAAAPFQLSPWGTLSPPQPRASALSPGAATTTATPTRHTTSTSTAAGARHRRFRRRRRSAAPRRPPPPPR